MEKRKKEKKGKRIIFRIIPVILIPAFCVLTIISTHSKRLVTNTIGNIIYIILALLIYLFIVGIFILMRKGKKTKKSKGKKVLSAIKYIVTILYVAGCITFVVLLYGPNKSFKNWLISTAMQTMNHQYLCKWFYNDNEIDKVLKNNYVKEEDEETNTDLIKIQEQETYANEYEEAILKHDKNAKYKIIELEVNGQRAYLAAIYDPSKVRVATTKYLGTKGQYVTEMAKDNDAILAINGGGFVDPGYNGTGGKPCSVTFSFGKVITNNNYSYYTSSGGLIALTNENKLIFIKNPTANKAMAQGVRDGVYWAPFLIVNGKKSFIKGNGGWGYAARTAIGQRSDGIILLLVVDSNASRTKGADMVDLTEIMSNYGAVNAANLDGGTSSVMVLPKAEALKYGKNCEDDYCYINDPINGSLKHRTRAIATSIIVTK